MDNSESPDWERISELRPQLHRHVHTYPQVYRGDRWYVLHDASNGKHIRVNDSAYAFIGRLNGELTVDDIWQSICHKLGDEAPDRTEIIQILAQLFAIDALKSGLPVDAKEYFKRQQDQQRLRSLMNPLVIRLPLFDPDALLNTMVVLARPLFSPGGLILWSVTIGIAFLLALVNLPALLTAVNEDLLATENLILMVLLYTAVKLVHEFAHALTVKMWGGEVHEMGITLLVMVPVPHVDASSAWAFRAKHKRILVGAAGILAELFVAAVALLVWLAVEPGLVQDVALNLVLICSFSTLVFNANPLLRFDGYYILQDLVEIPNLSSRATRYHLYLIKRYLFGLDQALSPQTARGEQAWFACYGLAAMLYRLTILAAITLYLVEEFLIVGVALGAWAVATQVVMPMVRGLQFLIFGPQLQEQRRRAGVVTALLLTGVIAMLGFVPVSLTTRAEGVVWVADQAQVFAESSGFIDELMVQSGERVAAGTPLLSMRDPVLNARIAVLEASKRWLTVRSSSEWLKQQVQSQITREELVALKAELELLQEKAAALLVRSRVAGKVILPEENTRRGMYVRQGQLLGYVSNQGRLIVRSVVSQADIGLVRRSVNSVQVRLAENLAEEVEARILRETPAGSTVLPSAALGKGGGGNIELSTKSANASARIAVEKVFRVDLALPQGLHVSGLGERAYILFDHGAEPLAEQWFRSARQLLLSRLSI